VGQRVILVTGASSGIGAACAAHLARKGHRVVGVSRSGTRRLDIRDPAAVERTVKEVVDELGRLDAVVSAAGIAVAGPLEDTPIELIKAQL
jgi:NAD(P)-dependent dehydrogenase (short-subunit alcohol dehydrogenase family)